MKLFIAFLLIAAIALSGCTDASQQPPVELCDGEDCSVAAGIPVEREVSGLTLGGHLAGKKVYLLPDEINFPNCWKDSVTWTGEDLYYAVTALDFTKLLTGTAYEFKPECTLPPEQEGSEFSIYRARPVKGGWEVNFQSIGLDSQAAGMSLSGNRLE